MLVGQWELKLSDVRLRELKLKSGLLPKTRGWDRLASPAKEAKIKLFATLSLATASNLPCARGDRMEK